MVNSHHVLTAIKDSFVEMDNAFIYAIQTAQAFDEAMALDYQTVNLIEDVYNTTFEDFAQLINPYQDSDMGLTDEIKTKIDHGEHLTMNQQYIDELQNLIQEVDEMSNDIDEIIENIDTPGLSHQYIDHLTHSINIKPAIDKFTQVLNNYFQVNV